jgi:ADP-ribosylglycohydrolase
VSAVSWALPAATSNPATFDPRAFLRALQGASRTEIMQAKLKALLDCLVHDETDTYAIGSVGNGIRASEAVAAALWAFVRHGTMPEKCVILAVGLGGDTDTIAAMAGALVGALHGTAWIPSRWYEMMENGRHGRDEIVDVGRRLAKLDLQERHDITP